MIDLGKVILRIPEKRDAESIFENYTQDPEVTKYLIWVPHKNLDESVQWIDHCIEVSESGKNLVFIIAEKISDEAIGMIDARIAGHEACIGYVLSRKFWGQGIMTKALAAIIEELMKRPAIFRIFATHDLENPASGKVMEKAGMKFEGILRRSSIHPNISAEPRDSKLWAIVR